MRIIILREKDIPGLPFPYLTMSLPCSDDGRGRSIRVANINGIYCLSTGFYRNGDPITVPLAEKYQQSIGDYVRSLN